LVAKAGVCGEKLRGLGMMVNNFGKRSRGKISQGLIECER